MTDPFRRRFGFFMVHEAIESAVALDVLVQAIERVKSAKPKAVTEALHGARFEGGWTKALLVAQFNSIRLASTRCWYRSWSSGARRSL